MPAPIFSGADYQSALQSLLPRGYGWPRDPSSVQAQTLGGFAPSYARSNGAAANLLVDAFPGSTVQLLPEWETTLGLPDPCAGLQPTVQARRAQVVARLTGIGGQSAAYCIAQAARLGYSITIQQFAPSRFGQPFGASFGGTDWAYAWQVTVAQYTINRFRFGTDAFGESFASWGSTVLQCELLASKPAHTILNFQYTN